jgi:cobalt-zinc-cadmium resistance protein CzcA
VRRVRSSSTLGVTQITVEFEPDADYPRSRQFVAERIGQVPLPPDTEAPLLSSLTGRLNEIFEFTREAEPGSVDLMALRDLAEFEVRNRIQAVPGVATVERLGGYLREFQIQLDPDRMAARGVTLEEVMHAARGASAQGAGGFVTQGQMEWTVRAIGRPQAGQGGDAEARARAIADIRSTVVAVRGDTPVVLGDVTDVREGPAVRRGIAHRLSSEVVSCRVVKQFGADSVAVAAGVATPSTRCRTLRTASPCMVYDQSGWSPRRSAASAGQCHRRRAGGRHPVRPGQRRAACWSQTLPLSLALSGLLLAWPHRHRTAPRQPGVAVPALRLVIMAENIVHRMTQRRAEPHVDRPSRGHQVSRRIAFAT